MVGTSNRQARGTASLQDDGAAVAILVEHGGAADLIVPDNAAEMQEAMKLCLFSMFVARIILQSFPKLNSNLRSMALPGNSLGLRLTLLRSILTTLVGT